MIRIGLEGSLIIAKHDSLCSPSVLTLIERVEGETVPIGPACLAATTI